MTNKPTLEKRLLLRQYPKDITPIMTQTWNNQFFFHWQFEVAEIQKYIPQGLSVDQYQEKAYVGISLSSIEDIQLKLMLPLPAIKDYSEVAVRTYVYDQNGSPGVWFFSLDIDNALVVQIASLFLGLPYHSAEIEIEENKTQEISYKCKRINSADRLVASCRSSDKEIDYHPDSLEFFLVERYLLFVLKDNQLTAGRIYHPPYKLYSGQVLNFDSNLFQKDLPLPIHICYSKKVEVEIFNFSES